ncbi:NprX family peptide pheromone [Bacillus cytotoxicus]|uniref:NprX family peptide pheromone n=1 Tax=Bacillus cytotoxicus TaxID=580165 RepID=A0ACC6A9W6_9BACI|nr:NprX family peptide pheromone [Bacillus cytotoxicus]
MKKAVIGIVLTMAALVVIADTQYTHVPDVFGQGTDTVETVNV